jgi:hypothetical protein
VLRSVEIVFFVVSRDCVGLDLDLSAPCLGLEVFAAEVAVVLGEGQVEEGRAARPAP